MLLVVFLHIFVVIVGVGVILPRLLLGYKSRAFALLRRGLFRRLGRLGWFRLFGLFLCLLSIGLLFLLGLSLELSKLGNRGRLCKLALSKLRLFLLDLALHEIHVSIVLGWNVV